LKSQLLFTLRQQPKISWAKQVFYFATTKENPADQASFLFRHNKRKSGRPSKFFFIPPQQKKIWQAKQIFLFRHNKRKSGRPNKFFYVATTKKIRQAKQIFLFRHNKRKSGRPSKFFYVATTKEKNFGPRKFFYSATTKENPVGQANFFIPPQQKKIWQAKQVFLCRHNKRKSGRPRKFFLCRHNKRKSGRPRKFSYVATTTKENLAGQASFLMSPQQQKIWRAKQVYFYVATCASRPVSAVFVFGFNRCQIKWFLFKSISMGMHSGSGDHENTTVKPIKRMS